MIAWLAYTIVVTLLLGAAALAAEASARLRRTSTRWIWAAAIVAAPVLPAVISTVSIQLPANLAPWSASAPIVLREATRPALTPSAWLPAKTSAVANQGASSIDRTLERAWIAASLAMLLALAASAAALQVRRRRWPQREPAAW